MTLTFSPPVDHHGAELAELALLRRVVAELRRVAEAAERGDREQRVAHVPGTEAMLEVVALRRAFNGALDRSDAFGREVSGALEAIAQGNCFRPVLPAGLEGAFAPGVAAINAARESMIAARRRQAEIEGERIRLAGEFEATVLAVAEQVAAAATELSSTAETLAASTGAAVREAEAASELVVRLGTSTDQIHDVAEVISSVAHQTRMLAINAQIEAHRVGPLGKGFEVVAGEVKSLADATATSAVDIADQVTSIVGATTTSVAAVSAVADTLRGMEPMVDDVRAAVDGGSHPHLGLGPVAGLAQMAELLRADLVAFLAVLRGT